MHIKKTQAKTIQNSESCLVHEYAYPSNLSSLAVAVIDGRYPERGMASNQRCEEVYYVVSGSGIVYSEKGNANLHEGDAYFFEKGEKFYVEGESLTVVLVNAPKWTEEQHQIIES